jgi:hypothetical protein
MLYHASHVHAWISMQVEEDKGEKVWLRVQSPRVRLFAASHQLLIHPNQPVWTT